MYLHIYIHTNTGIHTFFFCDRIFMLSRMTKLSFFFFFFFFFFYSRCLNNQALLINNTICIREGGAQIKFSLGPQKILEMTVVQVN